MPPILMPEMFLELQNPDGSRQIPVADQPITIGRHPSNLIHLQDQQSSRYHAVIEKNDKGLVIRDLDSSNGTKVNGRLIKIAKLGDGDVVQIGKTVLKLFNPSAVPSPKPKPVAAGGGDVDENGDDFDVVEVEVEDEPAPTSDNFEETLVRMAESLPDKKFGENEIALINTRGEMSHPPKK